MLAAELSVRDVDIVAEHNSHTYQISKPAPAYLFITKSTPTIYHHRQLPSTDSNGQRDRDPLTILNLLKDLRMV